MRRLILSAIALAALLTLAGCGARKPDGKTHVALWSGWTGNEGKAFQRMVDRFNAAHPKIFVENLSGVQDDTKTIRAITAGVPPDLFFLWNTGYLGPLVSNDAVIPLDSYFKPSGMKKEDFIPAAWALGESNGKLYSLPYLVDCGALYWNKDIFREAGLDPDRPPRTMEEVTDLAARLTVRDKSGNVVRLGLSLPDTEFVVAVFGGRLLDAKGAPSANDPRNVAAFKWYLDLVKRMGGIRQIDSFSSGFAQSQGPNHPFFIGKTALMFSGEWIPGWVERYSPKLHYGLVPVPPSVTNPGVTGLTLVGGNPICIPTESKHPKEAWEFIRWAQTSQAQEEFAANLNNVPNVRAVLHSKRLTEGSLRWRNYGRFLQFANSPNARVVPAFPIMNYYLQEMENARDFTLHGDKTPEQALNDVQRKVKAEWKKFKDD